MKISVIGAGYVGLVTGVGLAKLGNDVVVIDTDKQKVDMINQAKPPFYEEGLEPLLQDMVGSHLRATTDIGEVINGAEVIFICVQTYCNQDGHIDLKYVEQASKDIGKTLNNNHHSPVIVVKSTVIPGTTEKLVCPTLECNSAGTLGKNFRVAFNPEFLREGKALSDFFNPDRIIIGELDKASGDILCELYRDFNAPILRVDLKTAEMIKYASNAFLATKISYINEIGNICKIFGIDVHEVAKGVGLDARISPHFLNAGIGFGGSCLPKDVKAIVSAARAAGYQPSLLESVLEVNEKQPLRLLEMARNKLGVLRDKKIAVLGLAFKPNTDDIRESPALIIVAELLSQGTIVTVYDPEAMEKTREVFGNKLSYAASVSEAVNGAELVLILTEWEEFKNPTLYQGKKVIDGRRILNSEAAASLDYDGICW
ncbi:UDP-glucose dehydrogenase family protein [Chloroflexota bacterium]